jgi:spore coat protein U-like protein
MPAPLMGTPSGLARDVRSWSRMFVSQRVGLFFLVAWLALFAGTPSPTRAAVSSCAILNLTGVDFGSYNFRRQEPLDSVGVLGYRCSGRVGPADRIRIEISRGRSRQFQRSMDLQQSHLRYNLYLDASHSVVWGDGTTGTGFYSGRPVEDTTITVSIYGRIPPRQNVRAGLYSDQLVVTVLY